MLFILGVPHEDPEVVASRADIGLRTRPVKTHLVEAIVETVMKWEQNTCLFTIIPSQEPYVYGIASC